jgi:hypothetical protein
MANAKSVKPAQTDSKPVLTVYKIDAYMLIGMGTEEYALSSFAVSYSVNAIPTAQIRPAFGKDLFPKTNDKSRKVEDVLGEQIGQQIDICFKFNGTVYIVFRGIISSFSIAQGNSATASSMAITYNAIGTLVYLSALPPASRIVMAPKNVIGVADAYTNLLLSNKYPLINAKDIADITHLNLQQDCIQGILNILEYFYEMEGKEVAAGSGARGDTSGPDQNQRLTQTQAIEVIQSIRRTIGPFGADIDLHFAPALTSGYDFETLQFIQAIATQWATNTGFQILVSCISRMYCVTVPVATTTYIIPDASFMNKPLATIKATEVYGASRNKSVESVPLAGVTMTMPMQNHDRAKGQSPYIYNYYVFPEGDNKTPGMYAWVQPPPWFDIYRRLKQKEAADQAALETKQKTNGEGTKAVTDTEHDTKFTENETNWLKVFAKAEWGNRVWSREQITVSTAFISDIAPGNLIRVYIDKSESESGSFVGMVRSVVLEVSGSSFRQTFTLGNIRTDKDNKAMALPPPHPLYTEYTPKLIPLFGKA